MEIERTDPDQRRLAATVPTQHHPSLTCFNRPINTAKNGSSIAQQTDIVEDERSSAGNRFDGRDGQGLLVDQQGEGDRGEREHDTRDHREAIEVLLDHR